MSRLLLSLLLLVILGVEQPIDASYRYVGCYSHAFYDTYFTSSFMEPTLCFRMCDTPTIYLQKTVCRCSGPGLLHASRKPDANCSIPCTKPVNREVKTANTCGGTLTYSVYVQEHYYQRHGHLFHYNIQLRSCESWKSFEEYPVAQVITEKTAARSSLNRLERCAAACIDQNATVRAIAFNGNNENCTCIVGPRILSFSGRSSGVTILPTTACDKYCSNTADGTKTDLNFPCGSRNDSQVWAVYNLNNSCPMNFVYIPEMKKCMYTYKNFWNSCTSPSSAYIYDGTVPWPTFLQIIARLKLNESIVSIEFSNSFTIPSSWKCSGPDSYFSGGYFSSYLSGYRSSFSGWPYSVRYIFENGCLKSLSETSYVHRYAHRLCVSRPLFSYGSSNADEDYDEIDQTSDFVNAANPTTQFCPANWFDLNGRCYRISEKPKSIDEARKNCINETVDLTPPVLDRGPVALINGRPSLSNPEEVGKTPNGQLVQYVSEWQARVGFFLLDTDPDTDASDDAVTTTVVYNQFYDDNAVESNSNNVKAVANHTSIDYFMVDEAANSSNTASAQKSSCLVITRTTVEEKEKPLINVSRSNDCSKPYHVLCERGTLVVQGSLSKCLKKPLTMGPPALISNQMTHELCLSICRELQKKLALIQKDKCYCLNGASPNALNLTNDFELYRQDSCGPPCLGSSFELCGDDETVVVYQILDARRTFAEARTPAEAYPDFVYDSCVRLNVLNETIFYQFALGTPESIHPRHCLAFCEKYQQKFALINNDRCLCTNLAIKDDSDDAEILTGQSCSNECAGNYFYSCGHPVNGTVYSMYLLQPKCRHGFEVAENDRQCVYSHYSAKTNSFDSARSFCGSIGGVLAKIINPLEIQDILPDSILLTRLMQHLLLFYRFRFFHDSQYYWIDRTTDQTDDKMTTNGLMQRCANTPALIDPNCIAIQYVQSNVTNRTSAERCITESNECATKRAMPVCVDQHIEMGPTQVPPIGVEEVIDVSAQVHEDYSCGDGSNDYHFIDDYCYRIAFHEVDWFDAKAECARDQAILFVPEKSVTLQHIRALFLRQTGYTASGFAHVGVFYDPNNRTVLQSNMSNPNGVAAVPDSNAVYDLCEKSFREKNIAVMNSSTLSVSEKLQLRQQKQGCGYIDLVSKTVPEIRCDEIPCSRVATVICQKNPTIKKTTIQAKRQSPVQPDVDDSDTTTVSIENPTDRSGSPADLSPHSSSRDTTSSNEQSTSVSRDYAPFFSLLVLVLLFGLLVVAGMIYNGQVPFLNQWWSRRAARRPGNSVYAPLTAPNEFDLN